MAHGVHGFTAYGFMDYGYGYTGVSCPTDCNEKLRDLRGFTILFPERLISC